MRLSLSSVRSAMEGACLDDQPRMGKFTSIDGPGFLQGFSEWNAYPTRLLFRSRYDWIALWTSRFAFQSMTIRLRERSSSFSKASRDASKAFSKASEGTSPKSLQTLSRPIPGNRGTIAARVSYHKPAGKAANPCSKVN